MKVAEKQSDRIAEVHLRAGAIVDPLAEFGEYVDPDDGAICCYVPVPVEEKQKIWISGRFSGTTHHICHDAVVDGVLRKAGSFSAKKVGFQKNKRLDVDKFMFRIAGSSFIDTDMVVDQIGTGVPVTPGKMTETIGTIELRVYVTRQLSVEHTPRSMVKYYSLGDNGNEVQRAEFKTIRPTLQMAFEQDSAILDHTIARREKRKADAPRPGQTPWAIFRFHYRTPESMAEHNLKVTFDPSIKAKDQPEARMLELEPVPPLTVPATKKDDGDAASTKTSSPAPPDTPLTPVNGDSAKPATSTHKRSQPKLPVTPAKKMTLDQLKPMPGDDKAVTGAESGKSTASSSNTIHSELADKVDGAARAEDDTAKVVEQKPTESDTIAVMLKPSTTSITPQDPDNAAKKKTAVAVMISRKGPQGNLAGPNLSQNRPKPIKTPQIMTEMNSTTAAIPPITPTKRSASPSDSTTPELKRAKATPIPPPTTPTIVSRNPPGSPVGSPRPLSIERKVADMRKARAALRQKRAEAAIKQAQLDEKMKPYQKKLEDELERLRVEMQEEEAMVAEDEEHLKASEMMLAEFERADGDN